ncbi:MAG: S-layer homology domain-containing protein, partial [Peptococcales bacterium]
GSITVPSNMLTGVADADGNKAQITIGQGDKSTLPKDIKTAIGDRPLVQLTLSIDGKGTDWSNPNAPVMVSIPYTPTDAELANSENIVIWYIDGSGNVATIPNGHYDPATGMVTFYTTHFSNYAVAFNKVSFNDVTIDAWYYKAVSFIAAREITSGTGDGNYSPEAKLTRGQFIVMLMKAYGIAPDTDPKDNFADAGATYYTNYLAAAKRLSISSGIGNNMFAPDKEITRQEMFTLLHNALKVIGRLPEGTASKPLSVFADAGDIASWAKEAMTVLVETGTIGGYDGKIYPLNTSTRAEMAQVLYNLLSK